MSDKQNLSHTPSPASADEILAAERIAGHVAAMHGAARTVAEVQPRNTVWQTAYHAAGLQTYAGLDAGSATTPEPNAERFDIAQSLVRTDDLDHAVALDLVDQLTGLSDMVIIGTVPRLDGGDVLSPVWPSYWVHLFGARGFSFYDVLRPQIWDTSGVGWRWAQNTLVFVRDGTALAQRVEAVPDAALSAMDVVHPGALEELRTALEGFNTERLGATFTSGTGDPQFKNLSLCVPGRYLQGGYIQRLVSEPENWTKVALRHPRKVRYWLDVRRVQRRKRKAASKQNDQD